MSAPTPAPGDDKPREGYYPDPSIPGYVRYWNGASWVPGTSRPAPEDGEPLAPPPGARPAAPSVEETGPHFFDEDPVDGPADRHGSRPGPAPAWGAAPARGAGHDPAQEQRVAWPSPQGDDPRVAGRTGSPATPAAYGGAPSGNGTGTGPAPADGSSPASGPGAGARPGTGSDGDGGTVLFRRPGTGGPQQGPASAPAPRPAAPGPAPGAGAGADDDSGTMKFRAVSPDGNRRPAPTPPAPTASRDLPGTPAAHQGAQSVPAAHQPQGPASAPAGPQLAQTPLPHQAPAPAPAPAPAVASAPLTSGPGGGQSSWAQQVHRLAGAAGDEQQPVAPWRPPVEDPFQAAARRQAAARPAGLGKRLAARLVDTLVLAAVTALPAVPLGSKAADHINDKIDEAKLSGETVTVWLLDGTTSVYLGIVLAVLLLFGVVYEALPTAKWGRTLGKKLFGLEVRDIEGHQPPSFGAALRRWLVYSVPGLLAVGVVGVAWCVFDRPWRQCWHDKAAGTFVAG
ncbi:RDD family protein [Streptomyces sp. CRN 30]|uniref:RDD family protein n=1 Tax=Streptomyces sp. CRN 30 TaxID=3075613 RepID=UPI002A82E680|nr:RDD family protein [Streptomyces sp. CRN 30]